VKKKVKRQPKSKSETTKSAEEQREKEHQFDFGGLPPRDLKKNLGCG